MPLSSCPPYSWVAALRGRGAAGCSSVNYPLLRINQMSAMAPAWCIECDSWNRSPSAFRESPVAVGQVVTLARLVREIGSFQRLPVTREKTAVSCAWCTRCMSNAVSSDASNEVDRQERQQLLWKTLFLDHTRWWDNKRQQRSPRSPDFPHKDFREALWLSNYYNSSWVDSQLALLDARGDPAEFATAASLSPNNANQLVAQGYKNHLTPDFVKKLCKDGQLKEAVELLEILVETNYGIDKYLVYFVLKECVAKRALMLGGQVHAVAVNMGFGSDTFLCNHLIRMYSGHGKLREAMDVFRGVALPDAFMWSSIISAHTKQGQAGRAIELYQEMRATTAKPDNYVFVAVLQACAVAGDLRFGRQVHSQIEEHDVEPDVAVGGSLVNMYAKCGSLRDARIVFDGLCEKNVVTFNSMIAGYAQQEGMGQDALSLYSAMRNESMVLPTAVTFVCLLQACANMGVSALEQGKQLHSDINARGVQSDVAVGGSLVNMYAKCGSLRDARVVFDGLDEKSVVTWSAMIAGYAQEEGMGQDALNLYSAMRNEGMVAPNAVTFVCLLQACANMGVSALEQGKQLHSDIKARGVESEVAVGGGLVNMYAKCGSLRDAKTVFDGLREKDVVTWSAMIAGYAQQEGMGQDALSLYSAMRKEAMVVPDAVTFVCLLNVCASVAALQQGKELHSEIREEGLESDAFIGTSLVNLYAQCGRLETARQIFDRLPMKRVESWTALMNGYAEHGEGGMAIQCFQELLEQGIQPDDVTYICLLTACSRAGLVVEGQQYFDTMEEQHGVRPDERHYNCMVDLLGRSGYLGKAERMLLGAPCLAGNVVSWTALLSACKSHGDADLGRRCFEQLVNLEPAVATAYVLLGSIYANAGRWEEVETVEILRKAAGARKKAAIACIEVKKEVHKFTVGEERSEIAVTLRKLNARVKEGGHVPQTQLVLRANVSEQEKEDALCGHAEKLALAYGLVNTPAGSTLLVTKNLRMCNDCHSSTKIMSRVEKREILVRDGNKMHRFRNGACSCQDKP